MRRKNHVSNVILLILVLLQPSYSIFFVLIGVENNREKEVLNKTFENLESSQKLNLTGTPIYINGNSGWASTASSEEWCSGSGTFINPYIIENVIIDGQNSGSCIEIWHSNVYFIIRNCILYNSGSYDAGIKIEYSDNGKIINNKCLSNYHGIFIRNGINFNISNNFVNDNTHDGIVLESFLDNCTIKGNQAINNYQHGIVLRQDCNDIFILDNYIEDHTYSGILVQGGSSNNIVSGNTVINNRPLWGIWVYNSDFNTIEDNKISNNGKHGILIEESNHNLILDNIITYNEGNGIKFSSWLNNFCEYNLVHGNKVNSNYGHHIHVDTYSRFNDIYFNAFVDNGDLARDDGLNNTWDNGTIGNYWSDYNGLDANDDGIGDTPHFILGSSGSQDKFPIWD
ncbi:MAG: nitrous oxide reductase family maturation protein NosD, partial [Promethearchaeota archaeon]